MVNTFLPYADFQQSAKSLDYRRLGKQRVEAYQIINILTNVAQSTSSWKNHPACKMWVGYTDALKLYFNACVSEWVKRGYVNNMKLYTNISANPIMPWFIGFEPFHLSHQAALIRKSPEYYSKQFSHVHLPQLIQSSGYLWPSDFIDTVYKVKEMTMEHVHIHSLFRPISSSQLIISKQKPIDVKRNKLRVKLNKSKYNKAQSQKIKQNCIKQKTAYRH